MFKTLLNEKGQSLLEVIVVMTVGIVVISSLVFATIVSLRNAQFAKNQSLATKFAQEGIEQVRSDRDRNASIKGLRSTSDVLTWNDNNFWNLEISNSCFQPCYFKLLSGGDIQALNSITISDAAQISGNPQFKRVVVLSDNSQTFKTEKSVSVIVSWTDFAGDHQSKLSTVLRRL